MSKWDKKYKEKAKIIKRKEVRNSENETKDIIDQWKAIKRVCYGGMERKVGL